MTHASRFVAVAVLVALVLLNVSCESQTPEIDALRTRAEQGDAEGQVLLGVRYRDGTGVPQDAVEAVRWYRLAAEQGYAFGQNNLALMYDTGEGVPQDDVQAHMWFNLAASLRLTGGFGVRNRDRVAGRMTPTQIAEAQRLAREWNTAHPREP